MTLTICIPTEIFEYYLMKGFFLYYVSINLNSIIVKAYKGYQGDTDGQCLDILAYPAHCS